MSRLGDIDTAAFIKFLLYIGCEEEDRQGLQKRKGGHRKFKRAGLPRPVIVQAKKVIPEFIIRSNLRTLSVSVDDFLAILGRL